MPASLIPPSNKSSVKTRKERKQNQVMREANQRTQESLERINAENTNPNSRT